MQETVSQKSLRRAVVLASFCLIHSFAPACGSHDDGSKGSEPSTVSAATRARVTFQNFDAGGRVSPPWVNGLLLAKLIETSKLESLADRRAKVAPLALKEFRYINTDQDSSALIAVNDEVVVIAAPGTGSFQDWFQDLQIRLVQAWDLNFEVHNGFYRKVRAIEGDVVESLTKLKREDAQSNRSRKLWLTGHSQGGAMMQILAMRLKQKGFSVSGVMTFGAPKSGDESFRRAYSSSFALMTHRWINEEDPIPGQPRRDVFKHAGRQHYINRSNDIVIFNDRQERDWRLVARGLEDHGIATYIDLIDKFRP